MIQIIHLIICIFRLCIMNWPDYFFALAAAVVAILTKVEKQCGWETVDVTIAIFKKVQIIIEFEGLISKSRNHGANTAYTISRAYTGKHVYERCF